MNFTKPQQKYIFIWRIRATAFLIAISFLSGFLYVFMPFIALVIAVITVLAYPFCMIFYIPKLFKNYFFSIEENFIVIKKGFFLYKYINLDYDKIQFAQELQTPLQKRNKIYSLNLYTAGSKVFIDCISLSDVKEIKKHIDK